MLVATAAALLSILCFGAPLCALGRAQAPGEAGPAPLEQHSSRPPYSVLALIGVPGASTRLSRELPGGRGLVGRLKGGRGPLGGDAGFSGGEKVPRGEQRAAEGRASRWAGRRRLREQRRQGSRGRRPSAVVAGLHGSVVDSGYYAVTVYLGSPPQRFTLIADTGSSITYVPCASCRHCGKQHQDPWFDPSKSRSCQAVRCSSPDCVTHSCTSNSTGRSRSGRRLSLGYSLHAGGVVALGSEGAEKEERLCMYAGTYAESSSTQGFLMADSISFTRDQEPAALASARAALQEPAVAAGAALQDRAVAAGAALHALKPGGSSAEDGLPGWRFVFGCEMEETGELYLQRADGILGLGRDALSLPTQLLSRGSFGGADTFSLCFAAPHPVFGRPPARPACAGGVPEQAGKDGAAGEEGEGGGPGSGRGGELILGAVEEAAGTVWVAWDPLSGHLPYYVVPLVGMRLGPLPLQVPVHVWSSGPYGGAMLDSGTTFTYLPSLAFREFRRVLQQHLRHLPRVPGPDPRFQDICYLAGPVEQGRQQGASAGAQPGNGPCMEAAEARRAHQQEGDEWRQWLAHTFPPAALVLGDGQEVVLAPYNYLFQHKGRSGAFCLGVFENPDGGVLLGGILVRGMRVTYDRLHRRIGFAQHNCSTPPHRTQDAPSPRTGARASRVGASLAGDAPPSASLAQAVQRGQEGSLAGDAQGAQQGPPSSLQAAGGGAHASPGAEDVAVSSRAQRAVLSRAPGAALPLGPGAVRPLASGSADGMQQGTAPGASWGSAWWHALARGSHPVATLCEVAQSREGAPGVASSHEPGATAVPSRPLGPLGPGVDAVQRSHADALADAASRGRPQYSFLELPLAELGRRDPGSRGPTQGLLETPSSSALNLGLLQGPCLEASYSPRSRSLMEAPALYILALILASPIILLLAVLKPFHFVGRQVLSAWRPGLQPQPHPQGTPQQQPCTGPGYPAPSAGKAGWTPQVSQPRLLRTPPRPTLGTSPRPLPSKKIIPLSDG